MSPACTRSAPPSGWAAVVEDLEHESAALGATLGQPRVGTPGAAGLLSRLSRSNVWVHGPVDLPELLAELTGCDPVPDLQVARHVDVDADDLRAAGWGGGVALHRLRAALPCHAVAAEAGRPAVPADLPALRALHARAFGDGEVDLPDLLLSLPGLHLRVLDGPDGQPVATCGVRLRHTGAFVFGLATLPQVQRRGLGSAVLHGCLTWAATQGAPFALADVAAPVPGLWARAGFSGHSTWTRWTAPEAPPARG